MSERRTCAVDVVLCIDVTGSMAPVIDMVRERARSLHRDIATSGSAKGLLVDEVRVKIVAFRDVDYDNYPPFEVSDWFKENERLGPFIEKLQPQGGGDEPESGLDAISIAINADWTSNCDVQRHIVVVWTDAPSKSLSGGQTGAVAPEIRRQIVGQFKTLSDLWHGEGGPSSLRVKAKRMLLYAPDSATWNKVGEQLDDVLHFPSEAGMGLSEVDYSAILEFIGSSIGPGLGGEHEQDSRIPTAQTSVSQLRDPLSARLVTELVEHLDEDNAAALWRELEPLRVEIAKLLQSGLLDDETRIRTEGHIRRLDAELNSIGGALGGVVRSYYLQLASVLAMARAEVARHDAGPTSRYFQDLIAGVNHMAADPQQPNRLAAVLDTIEAVALEANPDAEVSDLRTELEARIGLGERVVNGAHSLNDGLITMKGLIGLGATAGTAAGAAARLATASSELSVFVGAMVSIIITMLAMSARSYRFSRIREGGAGSREQTRHQ